MRHIYLAYKGADYEVYRVFPDGESTCLSCNNPAHHELLDIAKDGRNIVWPDYICGGDLLLYDYSRLGLNVIGLKPERRNGLNFDGVTWEQLVEEYTEKKKKYESRTKKSDSNTKKREGKITEFDNISLKA